MNGSNRNRYFQGSRRGFIKSSIIGAAGASMLPPLTLSGEENKKEPGNAPQKQNIITRTLGKTGIKLPIVSMGVMNADNPNLVKEALAAGIVHLDTAHGYQQGRNEEMIGKVVKGIPRDSFVIATKVPPEVQDRKIGLPTPDITKPEPFIEKFEISLKRLGLEYVDILYLHSVKNRQMAQFEPLLNALVKLKKQGKTKFVGLSTHQNEPEVLRAAADAKVYDVVLTAYNFRQTYLDDMHQALDYAVKAGLGIVAMKTQAGVYWDKERQHPINMKAALKWALQNENIHTSIPGFTTFDQMYLDLSVMENLTLTTEEKNDLKWGETHNLAGLYCRQCGKCLEQCDKNIDIPTLMRCYMYAYGYQRPSLAADTLESLQLSHLPCTNCNSCRVQCAMGFSVREKILDIARLRGVPREFLV